MNKCLGDSRADCLELIAYIALSSLSTQSMSLAGIFHTRNGCLTKLSIVTMPANDMFFQECLKINPHPHTVYTRCSFSSPSALWTRLYPCYAHERTSFYLEIIAEIRVVNGESIHLGHLVCAEHQVHLGKRRKGCLFDSIGAMFVSKSVFVTSMGFKNKVAKIIAGKLIGGEMI